MDINVRKSMYEDVVEDHLPDNEEDNDGRKQVISLIVQEIVDHSIAPLLQVLEIR